MSQISSILSREIHNLHCIYFYREGIFLKAYERSAYAFVTGVQSFKIKNRFVKNVNQEIVSIGFPSEGLYKHFAKEKVKKVENRTEIELENEESKRVTIRSFFSELCGAWEYKAAFVCAR